MSGIGLKTQIMYNKIIAIGPVMRKNSNLFSGQSMMFQLFVDELKDKKIDVLIVDINSTFAKSRTSGKFSFLRGLEYFFILMKVFFTLGFNYRQYLYITTAQSRVGFYRDFFIINMAELFGYKIIAHQFGANYNEFYKSQPEMLRKAIRRTLEKSEFIVVEGEFSKMQFNFIENFETKVVPIENGLPERNLKASGTGKTYEQLSPFNLFYLSNMIESKGYLDVLDAANILVNDHKKNIKCVFAGKFMSSVDDTLFSSATEAQESFFKFIETNKLNSSITYFPGLEGNQKADYFLNSHIFLLPSYYLNEGQPVSVLEAMAYGVVPVVTKYRMIPLMVTEQTGFFVQPRNSAEIVRVILYLMNNPGKYAEFSQACTDRYKENFTRQKYVQKLLELFNQLPHPKKI